MATPLDAYRKERSTLKGQLTRHINAAAASAGSSLVALELRRTKLEGLFARFNTVQLQIELLEEDTDHEATRAEFETAYYQCAEIIESGIRNLTRDTNQQASSNSPIGSCAHTCSGSAPSLLPKIQITPFEGDYAKWHGFHDSFKSLVHENESIPAVHKYHLLKSYLTGDAATITASLNATEGNYLLAWEQLRNRFDKPRKIIQAHIRALFQLNELPKYSPAGLRKLTEQAEMHIKALKALNEPVEWHEMLIYIISSKIDKGTLNRWERSIEDTRRPTIEELIVFLQKQSQDSEPVSLISNEPKASTATPARTHSGNSRSGGTKNFVVNSSSILCTVCQGDHHITKCSKFIRMQPSERKVEVIKAKLCFNCLRPGHAMYDCRGSTCKKCQRKHSTFLHMDTVNEIANTGTPSGSQTSTTTPNGSPTVTLISLGTCETLLSTARVHILGRDSTPVECRVLLDSASQSNFMTEAFAKRLRLPREPLNLPISGIGSNTLRCRYSIQATMKSLTSNFTAEVKFLTIPTITSTLPSKCIQQEHLNIPEHITLADPSFYQPSEIDALLGIQLFYTLLGTGRIQLRNKAVTLQNTSLGWVIAGNVPIQGSQGTKIHCHIANGELQEQLTKFWELEECPSTKLHSREEQACEEHFDKHTTRDEHGRFVVRLPFKETVKDLGNSDIQARRRFASLEGKLQRNRDLHTSYTAFLREYEELGHMAALDRDTSEGCYLAHHAVIKQSSITTKTRVVFDGSAATSSGISLNNTLMIGPTLQDDLFSLILRFRTHTYVLTADIEKMYRQIWVHPDDRKFQKILWRQDPAAPIRTYALNTVTYGTACAPYLATRCLIQLAKDETHTCPIGARAVKHDFYMDDLITGASTLEEAETLRNETLKLTASGGFTLRQWASNEPRLLDGLEDQVGGKHLYCDTGSVRKTLGINWRASSDTLGYNSVHNDTPIQYTKRRILASIAQLFDPLGLLGPIIISAKIIMQQLWKLQLGWDDTVPKHISSQWKNYLEQLSIVEEIEIPRLVITPNAIDIQVHGFCDASEKAYGACIYIRSTDNMHRVRTQLICAKSRVAPLKTVSLPRLELCAAELLANLFSVVSKSVKLNISSTHFWSDSMIVLYWLRAQPSQLKTFVANRVAKIQALTNAEAWLHVASEDNPADFISRGQEAREFKHNSLWLTGPCWLAQPKNNWPKTAFQKVELPEVKTIVCAVVAQPGGGILDRFSKFNKAIRAIAYCLRFKTRTLKEDSVQGELSSGELDKARKAIIRHIQNQAFPKELRDLKQSGTVNNKSPVLGLSPILDTDGLIRVGGRLSQAQVSFDQRHPFLLPRSHPMTKLIIKHEHEKIMHGGTNATLHAVRETYWPLDGRNATRRVIRQCMICFRANPSPPAPYRMGDLPSSRVTLNRPFQNVGVDYCGPFFIKERRHRNQKKLKVYVAVFICFAVKAVHLEVVTDLTTEAFLASLRRFMARRGKPSDIFSDNGSNFIGAKNELRELSDFINSHENRTQVHRALANENIRWHFSPPRTPHFGGLWEAAVRSFKHHLKRIVGDNLFTHEQFNTLIIEIEAILNSRPLIPLSSDPSDLSAITPSHFLIGETLTTTPETDFTATATNRLSYWQHTQKIKQHFWTRWHKEYLNELTTRGRWKSGAGTRLHIGDLVVIKEEGLPALHWSLGRIKELHPGKDSVVRVATVRTAKGTYKRGVNQLYPLPTTDPSENDPGESGVLHAAD